MDVVGPRRTGMRGLLGTLWLWVFVAGWKGKIRCGRAAIIIVGVNGGCRWVFKYVLYVRAVWCMRDKDRTRLNSTQSMMQSKNMY